MHSKTQNHFYLFITVFFFTMFSFAQNTNFENVTSALKNNNYQKALSELEKIDTLTISNYDKATRLFYFGNCYLKIDRHDMAYKNLIIAKNIFHSLKKLDDIADCNILLLTTLNHQNKLHLEKNDILKELETYALAKNDLKTKRIVYRNIATRFLDADNGKEAINYFRKIIPIALKLEDTVRIAYCYTNIGTAFQVTSLHNLDSALYYAKKAVPILKQFKKYQTLAYNYNNQANMYKDLGNYTKAISFYQKADSIQLKSYKVKSKILFYKNMAKTYKLNHDYKNEAFYLEKHVQLKDSINDTRQNIAISEIKEKYDNEKLRGNNLIIEAKRKKNKNLLIGTSTLLLMGTVIFILVL